MFVFFAKYHVNANTSGFHKSVISLSFFSNVYKILHLLHLLFFPRCLILILNKTRSYTDMLDNALQLILCHLYLSCVYVPEQDFKPVVNISNQEM